jgi:hypothetical protein
MLITREDGNLELLTRGATPKHLPSVYGQDSNYPLTHLHRVGPAQVWTLIKEGLTTSPPCIIGDPDRGIHLSAIGWDIELIFRSISWSGFHWGLARDWGQLLLEPGDGGCHTCFLSQNQVLIVWLIQDQLFHINGPKVFTDNQMSRIEYNYYIKKCL